MSGEEGEWVRLDHQQLKNPSQPRCEVNWGCPPGSFRVGRRGGQLWSPANQAVRARPTIKKPFGRGAEERRDSLFLLQFLREGDETRDRRSCTEGVSVPGSEARKSGSGKGGGSGEGGLLGEEGRAAGRGGEEIKGRSGMSGSAISYIITTTNPFLQCRIPGCK